MAIDRVEIKDFLVFKGEFAVDFCPGVNVLIGANATGKTTLIKYLYWWSGNYKYLDWEYNSESRSRFTGIEHYFGSLQPLKRISSLPQVSADKTEYARVFIPEKDMLSNAKGLPETVKYGKAQFTQCEIDIIEKARVLADCPEQALYRTICGIIEGEPENDGQSFFIKRKGIAEAIPFSFEASGYRKFGLLAILIRNEQIKNGTILFWDEPENSLNPELVPVLVDILLELSRNGVQIFLATHSEILASYFLVNKQKGDSVMFYSLYKDAEHIKVNSSDRFDLLEPNKLTEEPVKLYEKRLDRVFGNE
jgi:predicted ATPase